MNDVQRLETERLRTVPELPRATAPHIDPRLWRQLIDVLFTAITEDQNAGKWGKR